MKKIAIICGVLAIMVVAAVLLIPPRGLVVVESVESGGEQWNETLRYQGNFVREDMGDRSSMIFDLLGGTAIFLDHKNKLFIRHSLAELIAKERESLGEKPDVAAPPDLADTGRQEKVGAYDAEIFTSEIPTAKFTCWSAKGYPDAGTITAITRKYRLMQTIGGVYPDNSKTGGIAVKTEVVRANGKTVTATMVSARREWVFASVFRVPAGYEEVQARPAPTPGASAAASPAAESNKAESPKP